MRHAMQAPDVTLRAGKLIGACLGTRTENSLVTLRQLSAASKNRTSYEADHQAVTLS